MKKYRYNVVFFFDAKDTKDAKNIASEIAELAHLYEIEDFCSYDVKMNDSVMEET